MTTRFGFGLSPEEERWAKAEGVTKDVIGAVLLLHERPVDEIAPQLDRTELEQVTKLVGRSPRLCADIEGRAVHLSYVFRTAI
jgi:hypothetical protein